MILIIEKAQHYSEQARIVLNNVQDAFVKQLEVEKATAENRQSKNTEQQKLYEEIKAALHDTYKAVEAC